MKSTNERVWAMLRSRQTGSTFKSKVIADAIAGDNKAKRARVSKAIHMMKNRGCLTVISKGRYRINERLFEWGNNAIFRSAHNINGKAPAQKELTLDVKQEPETTIVPAYETDSDIIDQLLNALAKAEPILRRLQAQDVAIKKLAQEHLS